MIGDETTPDLHLLVAHPEARPRSIDRVTAQLSTSGPHGLWLEFCVSPAKHLVLPAAKEPAHRDGLWKSTCFELFVKRPGSTRYLEFNFSPSFEWAAYEFEGYRSGMRDLPTQNPDIWLSEPNDDFFFLTVEALPDLRQTALSIGLSAVLEESDGTKSYWALAHPPGDPDFHHPDCFALELPAAPDSSPRT